MFSKTERTGIRLYVWKMNPKFSLLIFARSSGLLPINFFPVKYYFASIAAVNTAQKVEQRRFTRARGST